LKWLLAAPACGAIDSNISAADSVTISIRMIWLPVRSPNGTAIQAYPTAPAAWRYSPRSTAYQPWDFSVSPIWLTNAALYGPASGTTACVSAMGVWVDRATVTIAMTITRIN
jgi:hypothetical protein